DDLRGRLLEQELEASLPAPARGVHEMRGDARLAGTGGARDEDGAAPEIPRALEHRVEPLDAGRDALGRGGVREPERGHGQAGDAVLCDKDSVLVRSLRL